MSKNRMVGGPFGNDSVPLKTGNIFAALDNRKKKSSKSKDKKAKEDKDQNKKANGPDKTQKEEQQQQQQQQEPQQFWAPAPIKAKSWADVDDEDDDDYYATTAPPPPVWGTASTSKEKESLPAVEESDVDEDVLDEAEDDVEEEEEHETVGDVSVELPAKNSVLASVVSKEPERRLSKKELKKKELAELEKILEEFGVTSNEPGDSTGTTKEVNSEGAPAKNVNGEDTKNMKKKKQKKTSKETKDGEEQSKEGETHLNDTQNEPEKEDETLKIMDPKERLKKLASSKQKKKGKESDATLKAAAEASVRAAKLATAKKKEKNHYNQQPMR